MEVFKLHRRYFVQLVTVRWVYCPAKARLVILRCAVLCHHVSDSNLISLSLPTGPTTIGSKSLITVTECLDVIYGTRCVSDLWRRMHWGQYKRTYIVGWTTATLYYSRNSWHCGKTSAVSSEYRGSFSSRNNFSGPLSLFYAASSGFRCGEESFPRAQSCLYLYELCIQPVKNCRGCPWLRASTGYQMPKVQTLDSEVLHSMGP